MACDSSTLTLNWSPLQIGPGTAGALTGNFGTTYFAVTPPAGSSLPIREPILARPRFKADSIPPRSPSRAPLVRSAPDSSAWHTAPSKDSRLLTFPAVPRAETDSSEEVAAVSDLGRRGR